MSTRGIYTFKGFGEKYHVYKHYDNYPTGAADFLEAALGEAWPLPRYEPDEFAAAFIAANKKGGGDVRFSQRRTSARDVEFGYTVEPEKGTGKLLIRVVATDYWDAQKETLIWQGPLHEFIAKAETIQKEYFEK